MPTRYPATKHDYSDIINRVVSEFHDTPGGAPPGAVVEGIITAQQTPYAMSTGSGEWPLNDIGWHYRTDSDEMKWFLDRYGRSPNSIEEWVHLVSLGVDTRQEMGGYFQDWHAAAYGTTGAVTASGMKDDIPEIDRFAADVWFDEYRKGVGKHFTGIDELQPGYVRKTAADDYWKVIPEGEASPIERDDIGDMYRPGYEAPGLGNMVQPIIDAIRRWAPRVFLFIIGTVLIAFGIRAVFA